MVYAVNMLMFIHVSEFIESLTMRTCIYAFEHIMCKGYVAEWLVSLTLNNSLRFKSNRGVEFFRQVMYAHKSSK